jgi:hypothetical protein
MTRRDRDAPGSVWYWATAAALFVAVYDGNGTELGRQDYPLPKRLRSAKARTDAAREQAEAVAAKAGLGAWQCFEDEDMAELAAIEAAI